MYVYSEIPGFELNLIPEFVFFLSAVIELNPSGTPSILSFNARARSFRPSSSSFETPLT